MKDIKVNVPQEQQTVVWRHHDSIYNYNGWPSVCTDENGTLYATVSGFRIQHVDPNGKNIMVISRDRGETWSNPIIINDSYLDDRDTGIISLGGGKMVATWFSCRVGKDYIYGHHMADFDRRDSETIRGTVLALDWLEPEQQVGGAYVATSDDYGMSWSKPIPVPMTAPHGANVCEDGTLIYLGKDFAPGPDGESKIYSYTSTDCGKTWERGGCVPLPADLEWWNMHEPHVAQMKSGRLIGAIRVHGRNADPADTCYVTYSDDMGKTWTMPEFIGIAGLPPHVCVHSSGAVILSYACRIPGKKSEAAFVSYDEGKTWTENYIIAEDIPFCDHGYPATVELADGSLFTVYYQAYPGDTHTSVLGTKWKLAK